MIATVTHRIGQSIYDLVNQTYGTLNYLIKFCQDNNVTDLQNIPQQAVYTYDTSLVKYASNPNVYSTDAGIPTGEPTNIYITEDGSQQYISSDGLSYYIWH